MTEGEDRQAIAELIAGVGEAFRSKSETKLIPLFDSVEAWAEIKKSGLLAIKTPAEEKALLATAETSLARALATHGDLHAWSSQQIKKIDFSEDRTQAVVLVRHESDGVLTKNRWWVGKKAGVWRVYDWEGLEMPVRFTSAVAIALSAIRPQDVPKWRTIGQTFAGATRKIMEGESGAAEELLTGLDDKELPPLFKAARLTLLASIKIGYELPEEALLYAEQADANGISLPFLECIRATAHNQLGNYQKALDCSKKYLEQIGDDPDGWLETGKALAGLGRFNEAAEAHRAGLRDYASSWENLVQLGSVLPAEEKDEIAQWFAAMPNPKEHFETIAELFAQDGHDRSLEVLVRSYRRIEPGDPNVDYYDAQVRILRKEYEEAAQILKAAIPAVEDEDERRFYEESLIDARLMQGKPVLAYEESPDREHAFKYIAENLGDDGKSEVLLALVKTHKADFPDDSSLPLWEAEAKWLGQDYEAVVELLTKAKGNLETEEDALIQMEDRLIRSLVRLKRLDEARKEAEDPTSRDEDPYHLLMVESAAGNVEAATQIFERCLEAGYDVKSLLDDDDMRPLLKAEPFKALRERHLKAEKPVISLVFLLSKPRVLSDDTLRNAIERAWKVELSQDDQQTMEFVVGESPTFAAEVRGRFFLIHNFDKPYLDPEKASEGVLELRLLKAIKEHRSWMSVDFVGDSEDLDLSAAWMQIGSLMAELAGDDCLALYAPQKQLMTVYHNELKKTLCGPDPLSALDIQVEVPVITVAPEDDRMKAAIGEARRRWPEFLQAFGKRQPDQLFSVKAPFTEGDKTEHMWITVSGIENGVISGTLGNDPVDLRKLSEGYAVQVKVEQISDWLCVNGDGTKGGFTIKVLQEIRQGKN